MTTVFQYTLSVLCFDDSGRTPLETGNSGPCPWPCSGYNQYKHRKQKMISSRNHQRWSPRCNNSQVKSQSLQQGGSAIAIVSCCLEEAETKQSIKSDICIWLKHYLWLKRPGFDNDAAGGAWDRCYVTVFIQHAYCYWLLIKLIVPVCLCLFPSLPSFSFRYRVIK